MSRTIFMRRASVAISAAAMLLLAACSDDNKPTGSTILTSPTTPGSSAPPPVVVPVTPPVAKTKVTLKGKVVDEPIPNANVEAVVGATEFTTVADAAGNYTLPVEVSTADADLPVIVTATGVGEQASVTLVSLPGDVTTLLADAGSDGIVTPDENIRSNVTHVSTAEAVLVMEQLDGSTPTSQEQLDDLLKKVDPVALFDLAATIKLIVDTAEYGLPEGVTSTLEFAQNAEVRGEYIEEIKEKAPEDLEEAKQDTASSQDAVQQTTAGDVPSQVYAAFIDKDANFTANSAGLVNAYTFNPDGTGTRYNNTGYTTTTWTLSNNQINVSLEEPSVSSDAPIKDINGDGRPDRQVRATNTVARERLTLLSETLVSITQEVATTYPDGELPAENYDSTDSRTLLVPATDFAPFLASNFGSTGGKLMTGSYLAKDEASGQDQFSGDIFTLSNNGTGTAQVNARNFSWSVAGSGALSFTLPGNASVVYNGLDIDYVNTDAQTSYALAEITTANAKYVDVVKVIALAQPLVFDAGRLPGEFFQYGLGNQSDGRERFDGRLMGFSLQLFDDRTGYQGTDFIRPDGTVGKQNLNNVPEGFFRWSLGSTGIVTITRHFEDSEKGGPTRDSRTCDPAISSTCRTYDRRELIPFGTSGNRYYWLERRQINGAGAINANTPFTYLQRYYDMTTQSAAIVGSWELSFPDDSTRKVVVSFLGNGRYVTGGAWNRPDCKEDSGNADNANVEQNGNGWELGQYSWSPGTGRLLVSNVTGTDGDCGFVEGPEANYDDDEFLDFQQDGSLALRCLSPSDTGTGQGDFCTGITLKRIASIKRSLTGAWNVIPEDPAETGAALFYFFPNSTYLQIDAFFDSESTSGCGNGGIEFGNFSFDASNGRFDVVGTPLDTSGSDCGLNDGDGSDPAFFTFLSDVQARYRYQSTPAEEEGELIEKITAP